MLAQAQIDTSALGLKIANLNTQTTFAPLQPIHDTDIAGFLRHAHEQSLIASIEEGRRETEAEFYRVLDERVRRDWENRKKRIFEELGVKTEPLPSAPSADLAGIANAFGKSKVPASRNGKGLGISTVTPIWSGIYEMICLTVCVLALDGTQVERVSSSHSEDGELRGSRQTPQRGSACPGGLPSHIQSESRCYGRIGKLFCDQQGSHS